MSDELTRAIAEALHADRCADDDCRGGDLGDYDREAEVVLDALAPLIEARVREARAEGAADAYADVMRRAADESMACRRVAQDARNA